LLRCGRDIADLHRQCGEFREAVFAKKSCDLGQSAAVFAGLEQRGASTEKFARHTTRSERTFLRAEPVTLMTCDSEMRVQAVATTREAKTRPARGEACEQAEEWDGRVHGFFVFMTKTGA